MSDEHFSKIFGMQDRLKELVHIANTARTYALNITGEENHCTYGNYIDPKDWIDNELFPFFQTLQYRLTDIHKMLNETFEHCFEGCAFRVEEETEPTPEELAEKAEREQKHKQHRAIMDALYALRTYAENGPEHLGAVREFAKTLIPEPKKVLESVNGTAESGGSDSGADREETVQLLTAKEN